MTDDLTARLAALCEKGVELPKLIDFMEPTGPCDAFVVFRELLTVIEQQQEELEAAHFMARGWREKFRKANRAKREAVEDLNEPLPRPFEKMLSEPPSRCEGCYVVSELLKRRKRCATCELEHPDQIDGWHDAGCAIRFVAGYGRFCSGFGCSEWRPRAQEPPDA